MAIRVSCSCGRQLNLAEELQGKNIRCPECAGVIVVPSGSPSPRSESHRRAAGSPNPRSRAPRPTSGAPQEQPPGLPDRHDESFSQSGSRMPGRTTRGSRSAARTASGKTSSRKSPLLPILIVGGAMFGLIVVMVVGGAVVKSFAKATSGGSSANVAELPDLANVPLTENNFPARPSFQPAFASGVQLAKTRLTGSGPARQTQMNVYLPSGQHSPGSLGCVLVAPAGTNLLVGNSLDGDAYHDETLPYADAGFVAIQYSLDGSVPDMENATDAAMGAAYQQFRAAGAGTLNTKLVIEFVKRRFPEVDPARIYTAGHSSAGAVALLSAGLLPEVAACIAYAPCADTEAFHADIRALWGIDRFLPGLAEFDRLYSPVRNVQKLKCPMFVFQALDDSVVESDDTERFVHLTRIHNSQIEYVEADFGDHYDSMIREGIPQAITWLKRIDAQFAKSTDVRN